MNYEAAFAILRQLERHQEEYQGRLQLLRTPDLARDLDGYLTAEAMPDVAVVEWNEWLKTQLAAVRSTVAQLKAWGEVE